MSYQQPDPSSSAIFDAEHLRLEAVTTCVGFDDLLDYTLEANHHHLDTMIVVTSHSDVKTQQVAKKHSAICVQTDLFGKNGRKFNKGAAINVGFDRFQYFGWRLHLDADIALPDNFRRVLFNLSSLNRNDLYGADRVDVVSAAKWHGISRSKHRQHHSETFVSPPPEVALSPRYVDPLRGYCPIGYFQLWHSSCQKPYPWSLGTAAHDDVMFAAQWPEVNRKLLPSVIVHHLVAKEPALGDNWDGVRRQPRFE